jgi:hypothetical protein
MTWRGAAGWMEFQLRSQLSGPVLPGTSPGSTEELAEPTREEVLPLPPGVERPATAQARIRQEAGIITPDGAAAATRQPRHLAGDGLVPYLARGDGHVRAPVRAGCKSALLRP